MSGVSAAPPAPPANLPAQKPAGSGKAAPQLSAQGRALLKRGVAAYEADDPVTAIKAFEQMIQSDPQAPIARAYLGLLYVRQKRYADALKQFQEERKRLPNPAMAWAHIADVYYAQGDLPKAIRSLEKAAKLQPDLAQVYFNLAMLYPQTLDLNKGIWALDRYLALKPDDDYAHYLRGNQLYKLTQLDEAERAIQEAIRLAPQNGLYHYALAQVYLKRTVSPEMTERALGELQRALALDAPEPAAVHYHLGLCYQRKGDWEEARRELEASVAMAPEAWRAYYALQEVLTRLGKTEEASKARARFTALRKQENLRMQGSYFHQEVERNPRNASAYYQLAAFLKQQGDLRGARTALDQAKRLATANKEQALRRRIATLAAALGQPPSR